MSGPVSGGVVGAFPSEHTEPCVVMVDVRKVAQNLYAAGRITVPNEPQRDSLYGRAATPYREQSQVAPRPLVADAPGDSESVKRYRRFFETHDLHGLPRRDIETTR
jgi:hypothetical protein